MINKQTYYPFNMKKIIFLLFVYLIAQSTFAINFWGNSSSPSLFNNLRNNILYSNWGNTWNNYPYGYFNNPYQYQNNLNRYNYYRPNRFNPRFRGNMTGYSVPVVNPNLNNCSTNSYYVNQYGAVECNHDINGSMSVKIIDD